MPAHLPAGLLQPPTLTSNHHSSCPTGWGHRAEPRGAKLHNGEQEKRASSSSQPCSQHQTRQRWRQQASPQPGACQGLSLLLEGSQAGSAPKSGSCGVSCKTSSGDHELLSFLQKLPHYLAKPLVSCGRVNSAPPKTALFWSLGAVTVTCEAKGPCRLDSVRDVEMGSILDDPDGPW